MSRRPADSPVLRRRVPSALVVALALGGVVLTGCSSSSDGAAPIVTGSAAPTVPATVPATLPPGTNAPGTTRRSAPATTRPNLPASTASTLPPPETPFPAPVPSGVADCGSWSTAGFPTTLEFDPAIRSCLLEAMESGTPSMAQFSIATVLEGDDPAPVRTTVEVLGTGRARVVIDTTQAHDRPAEVTTQLCTTLRAETEPPFVSWDNCRKLGSG